MTVIRPCKCASTYQDRRYGRNLRVHNVGKVNTLCTVCAPSRSDHRLRTHGKNLAQYPFLMVKP